MVDRVICYLSCVGAHRCHERGICAAEQPLKAAAGSEAGGTATLGAELGADGVATGGRCICAASYTGAACDQAVQEDCYGSCNGGTCIQVRLRRVSGAVWVRCGCGVCLHAGGGGGSCACPRALWLARGRLLISGLQLIRKMTGRSASPPRL